MNPQRFYDKGKLVVKTLDPITEKKTNLTINGLVESAAADQVIAVAEHIEGLQDNFVDQVVAVEEYYYE